MSRVTIRGVGDLDRQVYSTPWGGDDITIYKNLPGDKSAEVPPRRMKSISSATILVIGIAIGVILGMLE